MNSDFSCSHKKPTIMGKIADDVQDLSQLRQNFPEGLSVQQILDLLSDRQMKLTEATFRKYVQLGLLPRSVRVGRKGKHSGSEGRYPVEVVQHIRRIKTLVRSGQTMAQVKALMQGEQINAQALARESEKLLAHYTQTLAALSKHERASSSAFDLAKHALSEARELGHRFFSQLEILEKSLAITARMAKAAV